MGTGARSRAGVGRSPLSVREGEAKREGLRKTVRHLFRGQRRTKGEGSSRRERETKMTHRACRTGRNPITRDVAFVTPAVMGGYQRPSRKGGGGMVAMSELLHGYAGEVED
jgi:hypothetical protein